MSKNLTGISLLTDRAAGFNSDFGMKWRAFTYALVVFHSTNDPSDGQLQLKTIDELLLYGTSDSIHLLLEVPDDLF